MEKRKHPQDWRFQVANKEAIIGVILALIHFLWWFGFAYGLGKEKIENYQYVLGMPAWFFYSCIVGFIVMVIIVIAAVKLFFKEVPFEDSEGEES